MSPTPSQAVVSKYFSKQMQRSPQEEICYVEYSHFELLKLKNGSWQWAEGSFWWGKVDVTWCLNPRNRGGTQRGSEQRAELVSTHPMVQKPSVHQLQTFLHHFQILTGKWQRDVYQWAVQGSNQSIWMENKGLWIGSFKDLFWTHGTVSVKRGFTEFKWGMKYLKVPIGDLGKPRATFKYLEFLILILLHSFFRS